MALYKFRIIIIIIISSKKMLTVTLGKTGLKQEVWRFVDDVVRGVSMESRGQQFQTTIWWNFHVRFFPTSK